MPNFQEITGKKPLINPNFMKGRIENPKYKELKRTIDEELEKSENNDAKKPKTSDNVQVEVSNLPPDWIIEGVAKISAIADAYGDDGEKATQTVFPKGPNCFVVVFKSAELATKMYHSLNKREIDDFEVKVTEPHPLE